MKEIAMQFIESAARVMWADAWLRSRDGDRPTVHSSRCATYYYAVLPCNCGVVRPAVQAATPPTPQYALLSAAVLLGKLEQANGCELATIVQAAHIADHAGDLAGENCSFDDFVREFTSAVALEALGHGVSWFDDHEEFSLRGNWRFVVPRIEFEYEETEAGGGS